MNTGTRIVSTYSMRGAFLPALRSRLHCAELIWDTHIVHEEVLKCLAADLCSRQEQYDDAKQHDCQPGLLKDSVAAADAFLQSDKT